MTSMCSLLNISQPVPMNERDNAELAKWIHDKFHNDPYGYCKAVLKYDPLEWQEEALCSVRDYRRTAIRSGHGVGKTRIAASVIHWFIATRSYPQIITTANTEVQVVRKTWRELAKVNMNAINGHMYRWNKTSFELRGCEETWFALAQPWSENNSVAFAGTHEKNVLFVFDEASEIPNVIWDVATGAMTTPGARWLALGNPTLNTGKFYECFNKNKRIDANDTRAGVWNGITVNGEDYVDQVTQEYLDEQLEEANGDRDDDFYRIRVRGLPPMAAEHQFIPVDLFESALDRQVSVATHAPRILGIDVATKHDRVAFVERKGLGMRVMEVKRGQDTMATVGDAVDLIEQARQEGEPYDYICIDRIGEGRGVYDRLKEMGYEVLGVAVGEKSRYEDLYINLRAELWQGYKDFLGEGFISNEYEALKADSIGIFFKRDSRGRLVMEKKDDMKKRGLASPDLADAACLTFYPKNPIKKQERLQPERPKFENGPWWVSGGKPQGARRPVMLPKKGNPIFNNHGR